MGAVIQVAGHENPTPRIRMLDGFNDGWIEFENGNAGSRKGEVVLQIGAANAGRTRRQIASHSNVASWSRRIPGGAGGSFGDITTCCVNAVEPPAF